MRPPKDPQQVARARARLALRAEKAWGVGAVVGLRLPEVDSPAPAVPAPTEPQVVSQATSRGAPAASRSGSGARSVPPTAGQRGGRAAMDLFGNPVNARPASLAADDPPFADPPPPREKRIELLQALDANEVTGCTRCPLCETRTQTVFGEGDPEAQLMFIGEGPGENEDLSGRPFVGKAGQKLNEMIKAMGLEREQVFIANVVKCRPPNNRVPTQQEVNTCTPYLHKQIEWIRPKVIVTLGLPATRHLLKSNLSMGRLRGQWHEWRGIKVMPTYHPAYLLRSYTPANRKAVWSDLQQVMAELGRTGSATEPA